MGLEEGEGEGEEVARGRYEVGRMYRLSPTEAPEEFDVLSGVYHGPPPPNMQGQQAQQGQAGDGGMPPGLGPGPGGLRREKSGSGSGRGDGGDGVR